MAEYNQWYAATARYHVIQQVEDPPVIIPRGEWVRIKFYVEGEKPAAIKSELPVVHIEANDSIEEQMKSHGLVFSNWMMYVTDDPRMDTSNENLLWLEQDATYEAKFFVHEDFTEWFITQDSEQSFDASVHNFPQSWENNEDTTGTLFYYLGSPLLNETVLYVWRPHTNLLNRILE